MSVVFSYDTLLEDMIATINSTRGGGLHPALPSPHSRCDASGQGSRLTMVSLRELARERESILSLC